MRNTIAIWLMLLALVAIWAWGHALDKREQPHYTVKQFCETHPDICQRGVRTVLHVTPTPSKGGIVIYP